jgi:hypothetical protein
MTEYTIKENCIGEHMLLVVDQARGLHYFINRESWKLNHNIVGWVESGSGHQWSLMSENIPEQLGEFLYDEIGPAYKGVN